MENDFLYNFFEGKTSKYLKEYLNIKLNTFENVTLENLQNISAKNIIIKDGRTIMKSKEDEFLMFAYKPKYNIKKWGKKPSYHTRECKTIKEYTHAKYIYTNQMPVDIYSISENKVLPNQHLKLCGNCKKEGFQSWFSKDKHWYEEVLDYADKLSKPIKRKDGYITLWKQISEAYRTSKNWTCENCNLNLNKSRHYLHTHHKNGNKINNKRNNLESLCILCHAFEHLDKEKRGDGFLELNKFILDFKPKLIKSKNPYLKEWERMNNERANILKR